MAEIIPAILSENFAAIRRQLDQVAAVATWVQLDIADGIFVPKHTWEQASDLMAVEGKFKIEAHLMIEQPEHYLADWIAVADRILIHPESTEQLVEIFAQVENLPTQLGLSLLIDTPLKVIAPWVEKVSVVQLMGIAKVGEQGQPFDERVLERVKLLRATYPNVKISVDGGVSLDNAAQLVAAGADYLVVGSALWRTSDPLATLQQFNNAIVRRQT
jgi:ribulose-phosphate 3-epimerase